MLIKNIKIGGFHSVYIVITSKLHPGHVKVIIIILICAFRVASVQAYPTRKTRHFSFNPTSG